MPDNDDRRIWLQRLKANAKRKPGIPEPERNTSGLYDTCKALKEAVELLMGTRKDSRIDAAVTWRDLVDNGIIEVDQVPRD